MNAHIIQSLQLKRARRAAFAPFVMPLRLPSFSQIPGALMLCTLLGALALPDIAAAEFVFNVGNKEDLSEKQGLDLAGDGFCNINESTVDDGKCTLRAAIEEINASSLPGSSCGVFDFANRIILSPGTYTLAPKSPALVIGRADRDVCVYLEGTADNEGPMATVIDGNATEGVEGTIDDQASNRIFFIGPGGGLALYGVTLKKGHIHNIGGGAIWNQGDLAIYASLLTENSTHGRGGAIHNEGNLWILESTVSKNWAKPNSTYYKDGKYMPDLDGDGKPDAIAGGAIANFGGSVLMYNVTVSGNLGGADPRGEQTGVGDAGGGILNAGGGVVGINNGTIAYNFINGTSGSNNGAGIYNDKISTFNIWNTIVANNYFHVPGNRNDCKGVFGSFGYNLVESKPFDCTINLGPGDIIGPIFRINPATGEAEHHPVVGPLLQNGGPTPTHVLFPGSPAIDAGNPDPAGFGACAETDQRYLPRPKDGPTESGYDGSAVCDIGAYEHGAPEISVGDAEVTEGNSGSKNMTTQVRFSYPSVEPINVFYWTVDGSAKAGSDYEAASGYLLFNPTESSKPINVKIKGDGNKELDETLLINISVSTHIARIGDGQAVGTIKNDD